MGETQAEHLQSELKNKRICRFCMSQSEPLTNIYSRENRLKSSAPLPLQVMACVSIEVFTNDGMPSTVCDNCRMLMEHCYRFKQMCKKSDTALRQYPLTATWPQPLDIPKMSDEFILKHHQNLYRKPKTESISPVSKYNTTETPAAESSMVIQKSQANPTRIKLLNKNSVKILNKNAQMPIEPILSQPVIKRDDAGNVEIVTAIIDQTNKYEEPDPVKSAVPVETNVFPCPRCERSFPLRQLLDIHMVNHTRERSFQCKVCDKRFFSKYDLGKHNLIHTGEKPFECVVCKKAFTRSTLLHRHEKIHTDQPKFLCIYCEKPFLSKDELDKHTERHKKKRPFSCKICGKCFAFKQGLERHETIHAKDQPYPCQYCDKSFPTPSKLSRHLTAHAGARPFPCRLCPNSYLLSHHLTRHMRSHIGSGSYKCYDCEKTFKSRDDLIYHSAVHATQTLICPLCKEKFESLDLVTEHIKLHAEGEQYACEFCDLIFMTAEKLQNHSDSEHVDDLAAYEEHTKNNLPSLKKQDNQFTDDSQDCEEGEVIEEFIIEEFHHDMEGEPSMETMQNVSFVKEESQILIGKNIVVSNKSKSNPAKILNSQQGLKTIDEDEGEYPEMEIEALEREEDESELHNEISEEVEEPPAKTSRITRNSNTPTSAVVIKSTKDTPKPQILRKVAKVPSSVERLKLKQPTINSVLQQLPKSVTVIKKEKSPVESTPEPPKAIRILNERVLRRTAQPIVKKVIPVPEKSKPAETVKVKSEPKSSEGMKKECSSAKISPVVEKKSSQISRSGDKKLVEMVIGDRKVKVQKIMMTKAEVAAMAKEGKIEMNGTNMILKQDAKSFSAKLIKKSNASSSK